MIGTRQIVFVMAAVALTGALVSAGVMNLPDGPEIPPVEKKCDQWEDFSLLHTGQDEEWQKPFDCYNCCSEVIIRGNLEDTPMGQEIRDGECYCRTEAKRPTKKQQY